MDNAVVVDISESFEDADCDLPGALMGYSALVESLTQQCAFAPLHDHVDSGPFFTAQHAHDLGVVETLANGSLTLKAIKKDGIGFHIRVGNLESNDLISA